jgi:hypothetical protein
MPSFQEALLKGSGLSLEEFESDQGGTEESAQIEESSAEEETISEETSTDEDSGTSEGEESSEEEVEQDEQSEQDDPKAKASKEEDHVEYVYATGPKGRRKIKVDYSNKDMIKRAFQKAVAADLYRNERDSVKKTQSEWKEKVETFDRLNEVFGAKGAEGVVELLAGSEGIEQLIQKKIEERERAAKMTPEEKRQAEVQREIEARESKAQKLERELEEIRQKMKDKEEQSQVKEMESLVYPAYERYNFSGRLGNEEHEYKLNRLMWQQAEEAIESLPEDTPLTKALVDKIYRESARDVQALIGERAKSVSKKAAVKRKVAATEAVQVAATKGMSPESRKDKLQRAMEGGDVRSAMSLFFRK